MSPSAHSSPLQRPQGRVLVVDDEPHVLAVAKAILEAHGFDVTTTDSGEMALHMMKDAQCHDRRFVVVILDLTMPGGMSGFEVMEAILEIDADAAVIACSGYFQEDARDLCQAIGFSDVLQKPYTLDHLCATVRRCLIREKNTSTSAA